MAASRKAQPLLEVPRVRPGRSARAQSARRSLVLGLLVAQVLACSGEAFHFVDGAEASAGAAGSSAFPALFAEASGGGNRGDAAPEPAGSDGTGGSGGGNGGMHNDSDAATTLPDVPPIPTIGPCGLPRVSDTALADAEVCVPAGAFTMGSTAAALSGQYFTHGPEHSVTLSAYFLDMYEVTVARYRRCVGAGVCAAPSTTVAQGCTYTASPADHERHPVTCVSWSAAQAYCTWDGGRRLPTEAEWERAARNAGSKYPWGDTFSCDRAVLGGNAQCPAYDLAIPQPAGSTPGGASAEGALDLAGNAAEWVADWYGGYNANAATDPTGPASGSQRIQRGGNWVTPSVDAVSYGRRGAGPDAIGPFSFRCVRPADP
jgi:formylglycine-generating enzyme required for sulfatase activity